MSRTEQDPIYRIIERAGEIIEKRGWTQGHFAEDKNGCSINWADPEACAFCLEGAMHRASWETALSDAFVGDHPAWFVAMNFMDNEIARMGVSTIMGNQREPVRTMVGFNDLVAKTKDVVLAAIESAKERRAAELGDG